MDQWLSSVCLVRWLRSSGSRCLVSNSRLISKPLRTIGGHNWPALGTLAWGHSTSDCCARVYCCPPLCFFKRQIYRSPPVIAPPHVLASVSSQFPQRDCETEKRVRKTERLALNLDLQMARTGTRLFLSGLPTDHWLCHFILVDWRDAQTAIKICEHGHYVLRAIYAWSVDGV